MLHQIKTVISVANLTKEYKGQKILDDISFSLEVGSVLGLLGYNGSGKTSLLKLIAGLAKATSGEINIHNSNSNSNNFRLGYVSEDKGLYGSMKVKDIIAFSKSLAYSWREDLVMDFLDKVNLKPDTRVAKLSKGQRSMLYLILSLGEEPDLLILDEPAEGFDAENEKRFNEILLDYIDGGGTLILSTHNVPIISRIADKIIILNNGRVSLQGSIDNIINDFVKIRIVPKNIDDLPKIKGAYNIERENRSFLVKLNTNRDEAITILQQVPHDFLEIMSMNLEEIYCDMAGRRVSI